MAVSVMVPFTTTQPGPFTLPHSLGVVPGSVIIEMTAGGAVWFQIPMYDATNLYLVASDAGLTGYAVVFAGSSPTSSAIYRDANDDRMLPPGRGDFERVAVVGAGVSGLTVAHD